MKGFEPEKYLAVWDRADVKRSQELVLSIAEYTQHPLFAFEVVLGLLERLRQDMALRAFFAWLGEFFASKPRWRHFAIAEGAYPESVFGQMAAFLEEHRREFADQSEEFDRMEQAIKKEEAGECEDDEDVEEILWRARLEEASSKHGLGALPPIDFFQYFFDNPRWEWPEAPRRCTILARSLRDILALPVVNVFLQPAVKDRATNGLRRLVFDALSAALEPSDPSLKHVSPRIPLNQTLTYIFSACSALFSEETKLSDEGMGLLDKGDTRLCCLVGTLILHKAYYCNPS